MAAYDFSPELWSREVNFSSKSLMVGTNICSDKFTGSIVAPGDKVWVWAPGAVTALTYTKNTGFSASVETTTDTNDYMTIDQTAGFHFYVDTINRIQGAIDPLGPYGQEAAYTVANTIDQAIMAQYVNVHASAKQYPAAALTYSNVWNECNTLQRKMTDLKCPISGRYLVVSPRVLEQMNLYLASKNTALGDQASTNGYMGKFAGFDIYLSHNVTATTGAGTSDSTGSKVVHKCLAGVREGITLAYSLPPTNVISYVPEAKMGIAVKGLALYGLKMWKSGALNGMLNAWWDS